MARAGAAELIGLSAQGTIMLMVVPDAIKIQQEHTGPAGMNLP